MKRMLRLSASVAGAAALVLAGCGGDASEPTTTSEPDATAETTTVARSLVTTSEVDGAAELCAVLEVAPFERRKAMLVELESTSDVQASCAEAIEATEAAVEVDAAAQALAGNDIGDLESQLACSGEGFVWTVTNTFDVPIGVYGTAELYRVVEGEDADRIGSPDASVIWRLDPGENAVLEGSFPPHQADLDRCSIAGWFFVADGDDLPGDASVSNAAGDVGNDPAVWLPILYQRQRMFDVTGDEELVETFEDLRSLAYARLVAEAGVPSARQPDRGVPSIEVCDQVASDDGRRVGVVYEVGPADVDSGEVDPFLVFGVFRRGADGMWRWLGSSLRWTAPNLTTCDQWEAAVTS